jgi:hypothetical protein
VDASKTSTVLSELKAQTRDLLALLRSRRDLGSNAAATLEKTVRDLEARLAPSERAIVVVGESADRHALLDAIFGEPVLARVKRETQALLSIRSGATFGYEAKLLSGAMERFQESVPEREEAFGKALVRARRERDEAAGEVRLLEREIEAEQRSARTLTRVERTLAFRLRLTWLLVVAWISGVFRRRVAPPPPPALEEETAPTSEARALAVTERIAKVKAREATLEAERARYLAERHKSFFAALRTLADDLSRGGELAELAIEVPSNALPPGVVMVSRPAGAGLGACDGCLLVGRDERTVRARCAETLRPLGTIATRLIEPNASSGEVRRVIEQLRSEAPFIAAQRAVAVARVCIGGAIEEGGRAENVCQERIAALESQRLTDPVEFRARSMARMGKAIDDGATEVLRAAIDRVPPRVERIKAEWRDVLLACTDRKAIESCMQTIQREAPARIGALVDETNEMVVAETQRASDTMQLWLLEEIHARYEVARRTSIGDGPAPVIADADSGEVFALASAPFEGALAAFEKRRVGLGLGGAAAGAVLGTLVVPVIGTAIGAFLGVFAGLFEGVESLRRDCAAKIEACVDESARQIRAQLEGRKESLAGALRGSLEDALDAAMDRFAQAIARLMEVEQKAFEVEKTKLARLAELRTALETHEARFAAIAAKAHDLVLPPDILVTKKTLDFGDLAAPSSRPRSS